MHTATAFFSARPEEIAAADEAKFFSSLKTANKTFRQTARGRLSDLDAAVTAELSAANARVETALDLGVSSGVTTLELIEALRAAGHSPHLVATDRSMTARLVQLPFGCRALVEPKGYILQYELFGRPFRPWCRRLDYFNGMALVRWLVALAFRRTAAERLHDAHLSREIWLVTPRLTDMPSVDLVEDDITFASPSFNGRFDLIRAANILNRHYFSPDALQRAVANVTSYLKGAGAWLLVVRTVGEAHNGTLFRTQADGTMKVVRRFGSGSEVESLILAQAPSAGS